MLNEQRRPTAGQVTQRFATLLSAHSNACTLPTKNLNTNIQEAL